MKLGYSSNAFVGMSLFNAIKQIAELGFGGIEIMADRPHLYPPDWNDEALQYLKKKISNIGLHVTNINSFTLFAVGDTYLPSWIEPEQSQRDVRVAHTLQCLHLADQLGCANISVPPGGPLPSGMSRKEAFQLFHAGLDQVIPLAEELGVKILIEPEPDLLMENSQQIGRASCRERV